MTKKLVFLAVLALLLATPAFAQTTTGSGALIGNWGLSAVGLGIAVGLAGLGQGRVAGSACEGIARNPGAMPKIQLAMIFGLALIESLVLFIWVMLFLRAT